VITKNVAEPYLQVDGNASSPFKNALYVSATHTAIGHKANLTDITVSHSNDAGKSWSTSTVVRSSGLIVSGLSNLAIAADGSAYVTWMSCRVRGVDGAATCGGTKATMWIASSSDGGGSWSTPHMVTTARLAPDLFADSPYGLLPNTSLPITNIPVVAVDTTTYSNSGNIYVAFYSYDGIRMELGSRLLRTAA
jgi:hypothetical protein